MARTEPLERGLSGRRGDAAARRVSGPVARTRHRLLGLPVDAVSVQDATAAAAAAIRDARRCQIVVTNANKAWQARRDARLRAIMDAAELVVPEWAMVWASRRLRGPVLHHVAGIVLMRRLLEEADRRGWSVFLLGARPEVVERVAARLRAEMPSLRLSGHSHGYLDAEETERLRARLREDPPDLLFVAMGSPRQEYWMQELPDDAARVRLGVGGSFDVFAGNRREAPRWARGRGLEWLYRLAQDPRRLWRRYLITNTWFVSAVLRERIRSVFAAGPGA